MTKRHHAPRAASLLLACLLIAFALPGPAGAETYTKYQTMFYDTFDTVVQLIGYSASEQEFTEAAALARKLFTHYHRLYNQYEEYPDVVNVCVLNREAKNGPVQVSQDLFDLLWDCREWESAYGSEYANIAFGSVLSLWHQAREAGLADPEHAALPDMEQLRAAGEHTRMEDLVLDRDNRTVYYADPLLQLDLGAVAKGYAAGKVKQALLGTSLHSFILNAGGNICLGDQPLDGRQNPVWSVGVQDPDNPNGYVDILRAVRLDIVTSGDYQRYYEVDGVRYAHLISPETLMPANQFRSVTVIADDSGFCDFLSTYLFIAPYETGRALIDSLPGTEAYWIFADGTVRMTEGMKQYARSAETSR